MLSAEKSTNPKDWMKEHYSQDLDQIIHYFETTGVTADVDMCSWAAPLLSGFSTEQQ